VVVGRVSLFTSPPYLRFAPAMDDDGGIVRHRWDDQHTHAVVVAMFSNFDRIVALTFDMLPFMHKQTYLEQRLRCRHMGQQTIKESHTFRDGDLCGSFPDRGGRARELLLTLHPVFCDLFLPCATVDVRLASEQGRRG
jgi:hypothetical protein